MDFRDTPEEAAFRGDLRAWLASALPDDWGERDPHVVEMQLGRDRRAQR